MSSSQGRKTQDMVRADECQQSLHLAIIECLGEEYRGERIPRVGNPAMHPGGSARAGPR